MDYYRGAFGGNIAFSFLKKHAPFTIAIMAINIGIFILSSILGIHNWTIIKGGMAPLKFVLINGEYWRFLSSMFIHGNLMHVGFNMLILMHAGGYLEPRMGTKRFMVFYLGSGLLVSLFTGLLSGGLSVGASGALFAVLGYILYYDLLARRRGIETYSSIIPLVLLNLVFTVIVPSVSTVGHLSGLAIGLLYAIISRI